MKYNIPDRIKSLTPYEPITEKYDTRLDANESCFNLKDEQLNKIAKRVKSLEFNRYPDPYANAVREKFADYYNIDKNLITVGNGSDELIALMMGTLFSTGDKLAVLSNDFSMYRVYAQSYGLECDVIPKREDLTVDIDTVLDYIDNNGISGIVFSNPCNPTSLGVKREEIIRLLDSTDALVILDEAYMDFWDQSVIDKVNCYDNLIILKTCSKAIGLAGVRLGFAIANKTLTDVLQAVKSPYNVNVLSQLVGEEVLSDKEYLSFASKTLALQTKSLYAEILKLSKEYSNILKTVYEPCTNFVFVKTAYSDKIFNAMLNESVAIRNMNGYIRICTGTEEENKIFISKLNEFLNTL